MEPLHSLLQAWRSLTLGEEQAILADDWARVQQLQEDKSSLQGRIAEARIEAESTAEAGDAATTGNEPPFLLLVAELIALERRNAEHVDGRRRIVQHELNEVDRTAGNLRGLNRAYGAGSSGHWSSYS